MAPRKPTGKIGPIRASATPDGVSVVWRPVEFSEKRDEVELHIMKLFCDALCREGFPSVKYKQNAENDFDFTLDLPGGRTYLELTEILYEEVGGELANSERTNPYQSRKTIVEVDRYGRQIAEAVKRKSRQYGRAGQIPVHLLTYVTHWRFAPSETVIRLAQYHLLAKPPIFDYVFMIVPLMGDSAELRMLYPSHNPLEGRSPEEFGESWYLKLDPARWKPI